MNSSDSEDSASDLETAVSNTSIRASVSNTSITSAVSNTSSQYAARNGSRASLNSLAQAHSVGRAPAVTGNGPAVNQPESAKVKGKPRNRRRIRKVYNKSNPDHMREVFQGIDGRWRGKKSGKFVTVRA